MNWLIYLAMVGVIGVQIVSLWRAKSIPKQRFWIRLVLNALLAILLILYVVQPTWTSSPQSNRILIISNSLSSTLVNQLKDSLAIDQVFSIDDFKQKQAAEIDFADRFGQIYLLSQAFDAPLLNSLGLRKVTWIPHFQPNELQTIAWKGILRKGEMQTISGKMMVDEPSTLAVKFGNLTLDSLKLKQGFNGFTLQFPAFSIGRSQVGLFLNQKHLLPIHFYAQKNQPLKIKFLLQNPDFESKALAEWLGKNGHEVEVVATVSKSSQSKVLVNRSAEALKPDLIITSADNAANGEVKKTVADGKSVFFFGMVAGDVAIKTINQQLGSKFRLTKISNQDVVNLNQMLTALPYKIEPSLAQKKLNDLPIAIQKTGGKIGISLLNETFPLKLGGDSLAYNQIWMGILNLLSPAQKQNIGIEAPIFKDLATEITLNNPIASTSQLTLANDTTYLTKSPLNEGSEVSQFTFRETGWQPFQDSLEVYVEEKSPTFYENQMKEFTAAHQALDAADSAIKQTPSLVRIIDWTWYLLFILVFTALWLEPKLRF